MKKHMVKLKDLVYELIEKGIHGLKKKRLHVRLKRSVKQSKAGKVKSRGSFAKHVNDDV